MAGNRVIPFLRMIEDAVAIHPSVQSIIEAMRMFGYINEIQYSELNTEWVKMTTPVNVRSDGAETIELARDPQEIPGMIPREF
jgi:hypothetical protein